MTMAAAAMDDGSPHIPSLSAPAMRMMWVIACTCHALTASETCVQPTSGAPGLGMWATRS